MAQIAVESSLRMYFKVLKTKKPENLYRSIINDEDGKLKELSPTELKNLTKLSRKSWKVRVIRYANIFPFYLYELDPIRSSFQMSLKSWIGLNILVDGGTIFKGRVNMEEKADWLSLEVEAMKKRMDHEIESYEAFKEIEE